MNDRERFSNIELDELLHPAQAFQHPREVVNDPDLSRSEPSLLPGRLMPAPSKPGVAACQAGCDKFR
jgi:hypothetical protein